MQLDDVVLSASLKIHLFAQSQDRRPLVLPDHTALPVPTGRTDNTPRRAPRLGSTRRRREATRAIPIKATTTPRTANSNSSRRQVDTLPRATARRRRATPVTSTALLPPEAAIRTEGILRSKAGCRLVPRPVHKGTGSTGECLSAYTLNLAPNQLKNLNLCLCSICSHSFTGPLRRVLARWDHRPTVTATISRGIRIREALAAIRVVLHRPPGRRKADPRHLPRVRGQVNRRRRSRRHSSETHPS